VPPRSDVLLLLVVVVVVVVMVVVVVLLMVVVVVVAASATATATARFGRAHVASMGLVEVADAAAFHGRGKRESERA
jgi:NADH:ubiquinone oxidoreductase subunit H